MTDQAKPSTEPIIVPQKEDTFFEMWSDLQKVPYVYVPIGMTDEFGLDADYGPCVIDQPNFLETLDSRTWTMSDGFRMGMIYTDQRLITGSVACIEVPIKTALRRYYHNIRGVSGVSFNPKLWESNLRTSSEIKGEDKLLSVDNLYSYTVNRFFVPRLVGFLQSKDPFAKNEKHSVFAQQAIKEDQIYIAYSHAALARELGEPLDDFYFLEALSLFYLSLNPELSNYFPWYKSQGGEDPRYEVLHARLLNISGYPDNAIEVVQPYLEDPDLKASALLELGRAHIMKREYAKAIEIFTRSLEIEPDNLDTILGKGIALRTLHYESGDREGLTKALGCFEKVIAKGGYHTPESLHHSGTIYLSLNEPEKAEKVFRETIARRESPVSRRNLFLVLHAQNKVEEAKREYYWLINAAPDQAQGLEQYLNESQGQSYIVHTSSQPQMSAQQRIEMLNKQALEATQQLKNWSIPVQGDLMDFRRVDDYFSYHAPGGYFLDSCVFAELSREETANIIQTFAMHLAGVLVRRNHAKWVTQTEEPAVIQFKNVEAMREPIALLDVVLRRYQVGATADNLTNLDFLVSFLPEYLQLSRTYQSPVKQEDLTTEQINQYKKAAIESKEIADELGFNFTGELSDLGKIDELINYAFLPGMMLQDKDELQQAIGENIRTFVAGLGLYLGFLYERYSGQRWVNHPSLSGLSLRGEFLNPFYPVQRMFDRASLAQECNVFNDIKSLESPLVCADLARKLQKHEIQTREELAKLLAEALPSVMEDDPTGSSLDRMVEMIMRQV